MVHIPYSNRVRDTSSTTGTGNVTVSGTPPTNHRTFSQIPFIATSDTFPYLIVHQSAAEWETGVGTWNGSNVIARSAVDGSSGAATLVNFSAGTKDVILVPDTNALGNPTLDIVTVRTRLQLDGGKIAFPATQVADAGANILDDYEEGTWTPTFIGTTTGGTFTYSNQEGNYVKIGQFVFAQLFLAASAMSVAPTGSFVQVSGLPFPASGGASRQGAQMIDWGNFTNTKLSIGLQIQASASAAYITFSSGLAGFVSILAPSEMTATSYLGGSFVYRAAN